jgi:hypothetical protein
MKKAFRLIILFIVCFHGSSSIYAEIEDPLGKWDFVMVVHTENGSTKITVIKDVKNLLADQQEAREIEKSAKAVKPENNTSKIIAWVNIDGKKLSETVEITKESSSVVLAVLNRIRSPEKLPDHLLRE